MRIFIPITFLLLASGSASGQEIEVILQQQHSKDIICFAVSADGELYATGSADHTVKIWDARTNELRRTISFSFDPEYIWDNSNDVITHLFFLGDSRQLFVANASGALMICDALSGKVTMQDGNRSQGILWAAFGEMDRRVYFVDSSRVMWSCAANEEYSKWVGSVGVQWNLDESYGEIQFCKSGELLFVTNHEPGLIYAYTVFEYRENQFKRIDYQEFETDDEDLDWHREYEIKVNPVTGRFARSKVQYDPDQIELDILEYQDKEAILLATLNDFVDPLYTPNGELIIRKVEWDHEAGGLKTKGLFRYAIGTFKDSLPQMRCVSFDAKNDVMMTVKEDLESDTLFFFRISDFRLLSKIDLEEIQSSGGIGLARNWSQMGETDGELPPVRFIRNSRILFDAGGFYRMYDIPSGSWILSDYIKPLSVLDIYSADRQLVMTVEENQKTPNVRSDVYQQPFGNKANLCYDLSELLLRSPDYKRSWGASINGQFAALQNESDISIRNYAVQTDSILFSNEYRDEIDIFSKKSSGFDKRNGIEISNCGNSYMYRKWIPKDFFSVQGNMVSVPQENLALQYNRPQKIVIVDSIPNVLSWTEEEGRGMVAKFVSQSNDKKKFLKFGFSPSCRYYYCISSENGTKSLKIHDQLSGNLIIGLDFTGYDPIHLDSADEEFNEEHDIDRWEILSFTDDDSILVLIDRNKKVISAYSLWDARFLFETPTAINYYLSNKINSNKNLLNITPDGKVELLDLWDGKRACKGCNSIYSRSTVVKQVGFIGNGNLILMQDKANQIQFYNPQYERGQSLASGYNSSLVAYHQADTSLPLFTTDINGQVKIWNTSKGNEENRVVGTLHLIDKDDYLLTTPDHYYCGTKEALSKVRFTDGKDLFRFEQFDLRYNRPDIVLGRLGYADPKLIESFYQAYLNRLRRMDFAGEMLNGDFHLPEIEIVNMNQIPRQTGSETISLQISAADKKCNLDRINVWINDVAVYGLRGIPLREADVNLFTENVILELAHGLNKIEVSVINQNGSESYRRTLEVICTSGKSVPDLYIVSIGVNEFRDSLFNLRFAAKDAQDIAAIFESGGQFGEVYSKVLTDQQVTLEALPELEIFLQGAGIDDQVILFLAGHGLLDKQFNYYFGSHDIDFANPELRGIPYGEFEALLDGIKPLKKLLFMDTCYSGEVDADEVEVEDSLAAFSGEITFRSVGNAYGRKDVRMGLRNTTELMKTLFSDLSRGTGATVISSSGGGEFAVESEKWQNGLFTFCLKEGINDNKADMNLDGEIMLSELQTYLRSEVGRLSGGRQQPTSRVENISLDYRIR